MTRPTWPTDERFRRIAAKIADSVMAARARGELLSSRYVHRYCPLGCIEGAGNFRPPSRHTPVILGLSAYEHMSFAAGFDGLYGNPADPWYRLGAAYRERYP